MSRLPSGRKECPRCKGAGFIREGFNWGAVIFVTLIVLVSLVMVGLNLWRHALVQAAVSAGIAVLFTLFLAFGIYFECEAEKLARKGDKE